MGFSAAWDSTFTTRRKPGEARTTNLLDQFAALALIVAGISYMYVDAFGGIVRWIFPLIGLTLLGYAPAGIAIVALGCHVIARLGDPDSLVPTAAAIAFATLAVMLSLLMGRNLQEALFCIYIWLPFFVAMAVTQRRMQDRLINAMVPIFFIAAFGVLLDIFITYPWVDATYEVMGQKMEAARDWQKFGMERISGFTRASYTAAAQLLIGYCAVEHRIKSLPLRAVAWAVGLVAIYYTTSNSPMLAMAVLPATYFLIGRMRESGAAQRRWAAIAVMAGWLLLVFAGPFIALTFGPQIYPAGTGYGLNYSSLADRVLNTWPNAIRLIDWSNPVQWLIGRGLGGIGSPQSLFHADQFNPGDNMAIYLFVSFGLLSIGFVYLLFRGGLRAIEAGSRGRRDFAMIIAMLGIGASANVIESVLPVMVFGMACARLKSRRTDNGRERANAAG